MEIRLRYVDKKSVKTVFGLFLLIFSVLAANSEAFKLPDSDQRKCYGSISPWAEIPCDGTGQDGSYIINPLSYTDNGNETVTDNNTGLMWLQDVDVTMYNWYEASGTYDATYNPTSRDVCGDLEFGGYSDWRLPTKKELAGLINYAVPPPGATIDITYFPRARNDGHWTSTLYMCSQGIDAWAIGFSDGIIFRRDKNYEYYVRCVRGTQILGLVVDNNDGTVTDTRTALMWQQDEPGSMSWQSALDYCEGLSLGGHSDWRLPNVKELESLSDDSKWVPAINTTYFPSAQYSDYWSSTTFENDPSVPWVVQFGCGNVTHYNSKDVNVPVRCVRTVSQSVADAIGAFRSGAWYLDANGSGTWNSGDISGRFGLTTDIPVVGDWNGDGSTEIGTFREGKWYLDYDGNGRFDGCGTDRCYSFGTATDIPVSGDWNNDGTTEIGTFRGGKWYVDYDGNGSWNGTSDMIYSFGTATDIPVTGDWNNDGTSEIGTFRSGKWYLDYNGNGVWSGCTSKIQDRCLSFGADGDIPIAGDWNGDGFADIGTRRGKGWYLDYTGNGSWSGCGTTPDKDRCYDFGLASDKPVSGNW